jgi:hypothetical protein
MSREAMQVEFHDAIKIAFMTKKPLIVVEGGDDLSIYRDLVSMRQNNYDIKPIEYFKNCNPGCAEIETQVDIINQKYPNHHHIYNFFKGIVDSDAKPFRGERNERSGIFYLNTYSFENSFITESSIIKTVKTLTKATNQELNDNLTDKLIQLINNDISDFYYITLEALKNAVVEDYDGLLGFSDGYERFFHDQTMKQLLQEKHEELDAFALEYYISNPCVFEMKTFCKGKWHLQFFLKSLLSFISDLHIACGDDLSQCPFCEVGEIDKCLYKKSTNMDVGQLISVIKSNIENADLEYINEGLRHMY